MFWCLQQNKTTFFMFLCCASFPTKEISDRHEEWEEWHYTKKQLSNWIFEVSVRRSEAAAESQLSPPGFQFCLTSHSRWARRKAFSFFFMGGGSVGGNNLPKVQPARDDIMTLGDDGTHQAWRRERRNSTTGIWPQPKGLTLWITKFTLGKMKTIMEDNFGSWNKTATKAI